MIKKILIALGILIVLIALISVASWHLLGKIICGDDQFVEYKSPSENHEIVSYRRNCGATTTYVYNVELDGETILRYTYGEPVSAKWIDDKNVSINLASSSPYMKIYEILESYRGVQIIFDEHIKSRHKID